MRIAILSKGPANYTTRRLKEEAIKRGHEVRIINYAKLLHDHRERQPSSLLQG